MEIHKPTQGVQGVNTSVKYTSVLEPGEQLLMTDEESQVILIMNCVFLCTCICLFGLTANTINILIFFKQGFTYTVNISLCGLGISDFCCLLTQLWDNVCMNPLLRDVDVGFVFEDVQYLTGSVPTVCFSRITGWITVFITAERCLSIARPLKVKQLITPKKTTVILALIYVLNVLHLVPEYNTFYMDWKFYPERNKTLYSLLVSAPDYRVKIMTYALTALVGYSSFLALIVFTVILVVKLNEKSAWRKQATSGKHQSENMTTRDKKTVKMIVLIATIMIVCYTPGTGMALYMILEPRFGIMGANRYAFFAVWSFGFVCQNVNSSVNIFLYYKMSTKYRMTFRETFARCIKKKTSR